MSEESLTEGVLRGLKQALQESDEVAVPAGVRLGRYRVDALVGRGGCGVVYRAFDETLNRSVALKMLRPEAMGTVLVDRFRREAQVIAKLRDPGIVAVYEVGDADGQPFIAMEFVEGETLATMIDRRAVDRARACGIVEQVARAVAYAHRNGVVHRDLKPQNIIVRPDGRPVVTDFGLAKTDDAARLTQTGFALGTPLYMSPEQIRGRGEIDARTDIYALGVILYEALAGRPPYDGASPLEIYHAIVESDPAPLPVEVPVSLAWIVMRCLRKDPRERYATAAALAEDVRRWRAGEPVEAGPPARMTHALRWMRRRAWGIAFAALLTVAVVAGVAGVRAYTESARHRAASEVHFVAAVRELEAAEMLPENARQATIARALAELDVALALHPTFAAALLQRGRANAMAGARDAALADFERAIAIDPRDPLPYAQRARMWLAEYRALRPPPRLQVWSYGTVLEPPAKETPEAQAARERASHDFAAAAQRGAAAWEQDLGRGVILFCRGSYAEAIVALDAVLARLPAHAEALAYRGMARVLTRDAVGACVDLDGAVELGASGYELFLHRGIAHYLRAGYGEAIASYDRALALRPKEHTAALYRGMARVKLASDVHEGRRKGDAIDLSLTAKSDYTRYIEEVGPVVDVLMHRAVANFVLGGALDRAKQPAELAYREGLRDADRAVPDGSTWVNGLCERGHRHADFGDWLAAQGRDPEAEWTVAMRLYARSMELDPNWTYGHACLGHRHVTRASRRKGQERVDEAKKAVEHAEVCLARGEYVKWAANTLSNAYLLWIEVDAARMKVTREMLDRAMRGMDECVRHEPDDANVRYRRGALRANYGAFCEWVNADAAPHYRAAIEDYRKACDLDARYRTTLGPEVDRLTAKLPR